MSVLRISANLFNQKLDTQAPILPDLPSKVSLDSGIPRKPPGSKRCPEILPISLEVVHQHHFALN